jgi:tetratricopeptide (TPR) repeat protein
MARIVCPTVVGRLDELDELGRAVDEVQSGRGAVLFVTGPAGVGKSRLLQEAATLARTRAATVLAGRCVPSTVPVPYRPLGEALMQAPQPATALRSPDLSGFGSALGWVVPAWRQSGVPVMPESPVVVAEALVRALRVLAKSTSCVLLIEDVQWADPETLHAIEYLADHVHASRVLVICSMRDDAPADVITTVNRLAARRAIETVPLQPLSAAQVVEMGARSLEAAALDDAIARLLLQAAEGLPFLVEEVLATAATSGALVLRDGAWRLSGSVQRIVPESFAVSVRERLHGMGPAGRRLLGAAAMLGRSFEWRTAARAAQCDEPDAHAVLERAVGLQLLAADGDTFSFRHALTRDAVVAELLPHERARLAERCLTVVGGASPQSLDELQLAADLADTAGQREVAASLLLRAGRMSLEHGAIETAATVLQRAGRLSADPDLCADVQEALADAASAAGDLARTREVVESLLRTLAEIGATAARRAHAHLLLARCAVTATHFDVAAEELARSRTLAEEAGDRALTARVTAVAAQLAAGEGRTGEAARLADLAAEDADATGQPEVVCEALEVAARCARARDLDEAHRIGEHALQVAEAHGLAYWRMRALYQLGVVEMFRSFTIDKLRRARDEAERLGAVATATSLDMEIAATLVPQFRLDEARETCLRCLEMAELLDLRGLQAVAHTFIGIIEAERGSRRHMENALSRRRPSQATTESWPARCGAPRARSPRWRQRIAIALVTSSITPRASTRRCRGRRCRGRARRYARCSTRWRAARPTSPRLRAPRSSTRWEPDTSPTRRRCCTAGAGIASRRRMRSRGVRVTWPGRPGTATSAVVW